jgi:hypothetical protein
MIIPLFFINHLRRTDINSLNAWLNSVMEPSGPSFSLIGDF